MFRRIRRVPVAMRTRMAAMPQAVDPESRVMLVYSHSWPVYSRVSINHPSYFSPRSSPGRGWPVPPALSYIFLSPVFSFCHRVGTCRMFSGTRYLNSGQTNLSFETSILILIVPKLDSSLVRVRAEWAHQLTSNTLGGCQRLPVSPPGLFAAPGATKSDAQ